MKKLLTPFCGLLFLAVLHLFACDQVKEELPDSPEDFSIAMKDKEISIPVSANHSVRAWLSKPEGVAQHLVICLHGGTTSLEKSIEATIAQSSKRDGGQLFLQNGYAILAVAYSEFDKNGNAMDRGFTELEDVLAVIDFIKNSGFSDYNMSVQKIFTFGHSRGGGLALLAGVEREITAAISAEGPLDWMATREAIENGDLDSTITEMGNFMESTSAWGDPEVDDQHWVKFSPGLRVTEFQSPFLVISGENDRTILFSTAEAMKSTYEQCNDCMNGSRFIFHPFGHTDWGTDTVLDGIIQFMREQ